MKRVSFHTLGCKVNFAESSTLAREFAAAGFERVGAGAWTDGEDAAGGVPRAEIYVVNTCSVTAAADKKCRNLIARLHRLSPSALIVVTGCMAQRDPEVVAALPGVFRVFSNEQKGAIVSAVTGALAANAAADAFAEEAVAGTSVSDVVTGAFVANAASGYSGGCASAFFPAFSVGDRTRSFLKVQDGCDYRCSYCTISSARGASRNAPIADVVEQARQIASQCVREIVLTGVNTGDFGRSTGEKFVDLLRALDGVGGVERYRISSIEPNLLTDEVVDLCAGSGKFMPHFHIPLQSGSDRILGLMRRRYTTEKFAERIAKVRSVMPDTFFGVDVIVGFPGETDGDFESTRLFLERVRPAELHVFPFSARPGTPAADMPGRVPPEASAARAAALGDLSKELHAEFVGRFAGTAALVLWESERRGGQMGGFTENYIRVSRPYDPLAVNTITEVKL